jgi:hypothetical protein
MDHTPEFDPYANPNAGKLPHEQTATQLDMTRITPEIAAQTLAIANKVTAIIRERNPNSRADLSTLAVDLAVVHTHSRKLMLGSMLFTSDAQLLEDCAVIALHLDRHTGQLPAFVRLHMQDLSA